MSTTILLCTLCAEAGLAVGYCVGYGTRWIEDGRAMVLGMLEAIRG